MIYIEDQAFLRLYDLAPRPSPSPLSPVSKLPLFLTLPVCRRSSLLTGGWGGGGCGAESHDCKKTWPSINRSALSGMEYETWPVKCDLTHTAELVLRISQFKAALVSVAD
jgi:hypothetical protein